VDESDAEIVRRSTNEDAKAFGELFWRHNGAVHGYLARRAGRDTADDLVAEVWLRAFRNRSNFDLGYLDARPWLYGIARNVLHSHWRQMNKALPLLPSACTDPWPDVDELLDQSAQRASLLSALDALSNEEREALLLVAWEQLSAAAIAQMLNVPASTIRNRLHRARGVMRTGLGSDPDLLNRETES
jgi:RNA polymerase sigma-70 factor (ECF subfamily)